MPVSRDEHRKRYGARHRRAREAWRQRVATGTVRCARCHELIGAREAWDLGHVDGSSYSYQGPEHARCNRAAGARASNASRVGDPAPRPRTKW